MRLYDTLCSARQDEGEMHKVFIRKVHGHVFYALNVHAPAEKPSLLRPVRREDLRDCRGLGLR